MSTWKSHGISEVFVRVARHQLGRRQLGVHQSVEEVALLLGLDRDVVELGIVDVELVGEEGSPSSVSTNPSRAGCSSGGITRSGAGSRLRSIGSAPRSNGWFRERACRWTRDERREVRDVASAARAPG